MRTINSNIINSNFNTIVLDLNGTITKRVSTNPIHIAYRNEYIEAQINKKIDFDLPISTFKALKACGLDPYKFYQQRDKHIDWNIFITYSQMTFDVLSSLSKKGYNLVLYTDCYMDQVEPTLEILKVKPFFNLIVSRETGFKKPSTDVFRYIANYFNTTIDRLLMIANDYEEDLETLQNIGGNTIWIKSEKHLNEAKKKIEKFTASFMTNIDSKTLEFT